MTTRLKQLCRISLILLLLAVPFASLAHAQETTCEDIGYQEESYERQYGTKFTLFIYSDEGDDDTGLGNYEAPFKTKEKAQEAAEVCVSIYVGILGAQDGYSEIISPSDLENYAYCDPPIIYYGDKGTPTAEGVIAEGDDETGLGSAYHPYKTQAQAEASAKQYCQPGTMVEIRNSANPGEAAEPIDVDSIGDAEDVAVEINTADSSDTTGDDEADTDADARASADGEDEASDDQADTDVQANADGGDEASGDQADTDAQASADGEDEASDDQADTDVQANADGGDEPDSANIEEDTSDKGDPAILPPASGSPISEMLLIGSLIVILGAALIGGAILRRRSSG